MSEDEFVARAHEFLQLRIGDQANRVEGDTELVASGILDSLLVLEFFFFLEEVRGSAIDPEQVSVEALSTIRNAYRLVVA
jgi:acyl carrier protein